MKAVTQSLLCLVGVCLLLLSGCGQKGDLTLPKAPANTPQTQQQTSEEALAPDPASGLQAAKDNQR